MKARLLLVLDLAGTLGTVLAIYLAIWLAGFHDGQRRWTLLLCLFAMWLSFVLGRSIAASASKIGGVPGTEALSPERQRRNLIASYIGIIIVMLGLGLVLRLTT